MKNEFILVTIKTLDPTNKIVKEETLELPLKTYNGEGEPMCQNFYVIELGDVKIKVNKLGNVTVM